MSKWCDTCHRNEITGEWKSCSKDCPAFGKPFDEIKEIAVEMKNATLVDKIASFFEEEENWKALKNCWIENDKSDDLRRLLHKALKG